MKSFYFLTLLIVSFIFIACHRNNEEMFLPDAQITIYTPGVNSVIPPDDTIYIDGLATSVTTLHGYELSIRRKGGDHLYIQYFHDHNDSLLIKDKWKNIVSQPGELEVLVSVILDHDDHRKNKVIPLQVR